MEMLNITKGEWSAKEVVTHTGSFFKVCTDELAVCNITTRNQDIAEANSELIADAGNSYQKLPILPSKLIEEREYLIYILKKTAHLFDRELPDGSVGRLHFDKVKEILSKFTNA